MFYLSTFPWDCFCIQGEVGLPGIPGLDGEKVKEYSSPFGIKNQKQALKYIAYIQHSHLRVLGEKQEKMELLAHLDREEREELWAFLDLKGIKETWVPLDHL